MAAQNRLRVIRQLVALIEAPNTDPKVKLEAARLLNDMDAFRGSKKTPLDRAAVNPDKVEADALALLGGKAK